MNKLQALLLVGLLIIGAASAQYANANGEQCPQGSYQSCPKYGSSSSTPSGMGNSSSSDCDLCSPGHSSSGSTFANFYVSDRCQPCPSGSFADKAGMARCKICPEGSFCPDPSRSAIPCPPGFTFSKYLNANNRWTDSSSCSPCTAGTFANQPGQAVCSSCPPGNQCLDPTKPPQPCPKGFASNPYGYYMMGSSGCQQCPIGTYTPNVGSVTCSPCPEGWFCPDPTQAFPCPAGTFRNNLQTYQQIVFPLQQIYNYFTSNSAQFCYRCPQGYFSRQGAKTCTKCPIGSFCYDFFAVPVSCPVGTYSNFEYGTQTCVPCPDGQYTTTAGNSQCLVCPKGRYCPDPARAPIPCPAGTYADSPFGQMICTACPLGTYSNSTGSERCMPCPESMCCTDPTRAAPCVVVSGPGTGQPYTTFYPAF